MFVAGQFTLLAVFFSSISLQALDIRVRLGSFSNSLKLAGSIKYKNVKFYQPMIQYDFLSKQFQITSGRQKLFVARKVLHLVNIDAQLDQQKLPVKVSLFANEQKIHLVGNYPLEEYLAGVLPAEMPSSWPLESLKAQAIASRTYVLFQKEKRKKQVYDVDRSIEDQVFNPNKLKTQYKSKVLKAIQSTKGMVLYRWQKLLPTFFHSNCGGHTEASSHVWIGKKVLNGVSDPYCPNKNWVYKLSLKKLKTAYEKDSKYINKSALIRVQTGPKNFSGRSSSVYLFFKDGKIRRWTTQNLRRYVGFSKIKSTQFAVKNKDTEIVFTGKGYGHGVGLCQHGAKNMALHNFNYKKILQHYYPDSRLGTIHSKYALMTR